MKTDSQLQNDVLAQLKWQPQMNAAHIGVAANHNVVTLSGQVAHLGEKETAEDTAKGVFCVKAVANEIEVKMPGSSVTTDQDIAGAAVSALKWDFEVPDNRVKVLVENGWVTLEGTLDSKYQRDAAQRCVQFLMSVSAVTNSISIKPTVKLLEVQTDIEDALRRSAQLDARRIGVSTSGDTVTLSGNVSSWAEHDVAVSAAWGAPGVSFVTDDLLVTI